jgi:hypothetical protein
MCFCLGIVFIERPMPREDLTTGSSPANLASDAALTDSSMRNRQPTVIHITVAPLPRILLNITNMVQPVSDNELHPPQKDSPKPFSALFWGRQTAFRKEKCAVVERTYSFTG